jgi:hypothetical protein
VPRVQDDPPPRKERIGVNLFDLQRVLPEVRGMLLAGKVDVSRVYTTDPRRGDERAVEFTCPLLDAACICDVLREHDRRAGDDPTRVYLRREKVWEKLPAESLLSVVEDGECVLNPKLFRPVVRSEDLVPLPTRRVNH